MFKCMAAPVLGATLLTYAKAHSEHWPHTASARVFAAVIQQSNLRKETGFSLYNQ